jgi:predicted DNA-binding transcriptional regulator AlpA
MRKKAINARDVTTEPVDQMRDWPHVHERTTLCRTSVWDMARKGLFPRPVKISPGRIAWKESDLAQWMAGRREW